jgi:hypothetical protein
MKTLVEKMRGLVPGVSVDELKSVIAEAGALVADLIEAQTVTNNLGRLSKNLRRAVERIGIIEPVTPYEREIYELELSMLRLLSRALEAGFIEDDHPMYRKWHIETSHQLADLLLSIYPDDAKEKYLQSIETGLSMIETTELPEDDYVEIIEILKKYANLVGNTDLNLVVEQYLRVADSLETAIHKLPIEENQSDSCDYLYEHEGGILRDLSAQVLEFNPTLSVTLLHRALAVSNAMIERKGIYISFQRKKIKLQDGEIKELNNHVSVLSQHLNPPKIKKGASPLPRNPFWKSNTLNSNPLRTDGYAGSEPLANLHPLDHGQNNIAEELDTPENEDSSSTAQQSHQGSKA